MVVLLALCSNLLQSQKCQKKGPNHRRTGGRVGFRPRRVVISSMLSIFKIQSSNRSVATRKLPSAIFSASAAISTFPRRFGALMSNAAFMHWWANVRFNFAHTCSAPFFHRWYDRTVWSFCSQSCIIHSFFVSSLLGMNMHNTGITWASSKKLPYGTTLLLLRRKKINLISWRVPPELVSTIAALQLSSRDCGKVGYSMHLGHSIQSTRR